MLVRCAKLEEVAPAVALACESFMAAVAPHYDQDGIRTFLDFASPEAMLKRVQENYAVYVAYEEEQLVGMAATRDGSHISMLFVAPHAQRRGIGRMLIELALSKCSGDVITVNASPNSDGAYVRFGFRKLSDEKVIDGIRFIPMALEKKKPNQRSEPTPGNRPPSKQSSPSGVARP